MNFYEEGSPKMKEEQNSLKKEFYIQLSAQKSEISDLKKESEDYLEKIKEKDKELSFFQELVDSLLSKKELKIIKKQWVLGQYKIPSDLFRDKEIKLPNLLTFSQEDGYNIDSPMAQKTLCKTPTEKIQNSGPEMEKDQKNAKMP